MNDILYCNSIGLVPGPSEQKEEFQSRVNYCLSLKQDVLPKLFSREISESPSLLLQNAFPATQFWYGIRPDWVSLIFSNEKLAPWHGGAAWIFQMEESCPTAALLQLRENFLHKKSYLGILKREELMAHELSHVGRMMFEEPQFEEILAYRSSESRLARNLGPLLQSSKESMLFVLSLFLIMMIDIFLAFQGNYGLFQSSVWLKILPLGLACFAFFRLFKNKRLLNLCLVNIRQMAKSDDDANAILYRLTDREIVLFAKSSLAEMNDYIGKQDELRWQVIKEAYLI